MRRIGLAVALAISVALTPRDVEAQQTSKVTRIGWLSADITGPLPNSAADAFREKLRDEGWVEGRNVVFEFRHGGAEGSVEERRKELDRLAAELADLRVDVIFASPAPAALAAKRVVTATPVVFAGVSDPVGFGLVASLARPSGNFTGVSFQSADLNSKRLDLLREIVPGVRKIASTGRPRSSAARAHAKTIFRRSHAPRTSSSTSLRRGAKHHHQVPLLRGPQ